MTARRVLVTGGAGFIGSQVAAAHLDCGDRVWIVDDLSTGKQRNLPAGAEFHAIDVGAPQLADVFSAAGGFEVVSHHAAQVDVPTSVNDPRRDARTNIDGLLNMLELCRTWSVGRVVFVSSGGVVYGEPDVRPTPETAPKAPLSPYGVSKLAAEYYLHYYRRIHGLDYLALRYSNVYGPRQDPHGEAGVVAIFSTRLLGDEPLAIFGDGEQTRDYVYVDDVVRANLLAAAASLPADASLDDRAVNIGTGVATSVNTLAAALMEVSGRAVPLEKRAERPGELRHSCLDCRRAGRLLGWTPDTALHDGLRRTYDHIAGEEITR